MHFCKYKNKNILHQYYWEGGQGLIIQVFLRLSYSIILSLWWKYNSERRKKCFFSSYFMCFLWKKVKCKCINTASIFLTEIHNTHELLSDKEYWNGHYITNTMCASKRVRLSSLCTEGYIDGVYSVTISWSEPFWRDGRYEPRM